MLGEIVWLMSQDKVERHRPISDLERQVMPAILYREFRIFYIPQEMGLDSQPRLVKPEAGKPALEADGDPGLPLMPIGAVLWAMVSDAVAKMIEENPKALEKLRPEQWRSGSQKVIVRIIAAMGGANEMVREASK
ncbi:toxin-activating lysine-acyltransferase [Aurantimonas sp. 22II-16-19i]|uniref:toxin-activating lysine-acyltransferase n=1 Tax=Aurantimonas sp. 22II-16-19i TaxID=1317114 RepID=UPI0009F7E734|nr:toxin-activating lysine-acyltransferase [Aurantimonas sp. 22II-16-19i]ORE98482.1 RTX toxin-activating protein C [Aurantimonas sp. 22II-16-19i]